MDENYYCCITLLPIEKHLNGPSTCILEIFFRGSRLYRQCIAVISLWRVIRLEKRWSSRTVLNTMKAIQYNEGNSLNTIRT